MSRARWATDALALAASPTFAVMALFTSIPGGDAAGMAAHASPPGGMAAMYLLMSLFHLPPWLRLASGGPSARRLPTAKGNRP